MAAPLKSPSEVYRGGHKHRDQSWASSLHEQYLRWVTPVGGQALQRCMQQQAHLCATTSMPGARWQLQLQWGQEAYPRLPCLQERMLRSLPKKQLPSMPHLAALGSRVKLHGRGITKGCLLRTLLSGPILPYLWGHHTSCYRCFCICWLFPQKVNLCIA